MKAKQKKLTPKQKKFTKEYQKDFNGTRAAKAAGYSENSAKEIASQNLTKPEIAKAIKDDVDKTLEKLGITTEYILGNIVETIERCKQAKPVFTKMGEHAVTEDRDGEMATAYQFDPASVLKGSELLGKYKNLKLWTDKVEHSGVIENQVTVTKIDLDERMALLKKGKA